VQPLSTITKVEKHETIFFYDGELEAYGNVELWDSSKFMGELLRRIETAGPASVQQQQHPSQNNTMSDSNSMQSRSISAASDNNNNNTSTSSSNSATSLLQQPSSQSAADDTDTDLFQDLNAALGGIKMLNTLQQLIERQTNQRNAVIKQSPA
jgi:hypothetical protein